MTHQKKEENKRLNKNQKVVRLTTFLAGHPGSRGDTDMALDATATKDLVDRFVVNKAEKKKAADDIEVISNRLRSLVTGLTQDNGHRLLVEASGIRVVHGETAVATIHTDDLRTLLDQMKRLERLTDEEASIHKELHSAGYDSIIA